MIESTRQQKDILKSVVPVKRVIACAGSGKTWVLTRSIADAIESGKCRPEEVLALTFTINAAENIRARAGRMLGNRDLDLDVYTFNSFGNDMIYQNSFELGLGREFQLITRNQSWQILYEVLKDADISGIRIGRNPGNFIDSLLSFIEDIKNNLISTEDLRSYLDKKDSILEGYRSKALAAEEKKTALAAGELFKVYLGYEKTKAERNMIDYSDQVFLPYKLLTERKVLREKYSQKYKYILIDEFQDTNVAQARLLTLLYKKGYNRMMIVGDDDQGIYSFRGACVNNILDFQSWDCFEDEKVTDYYLSVNFRSGPGIIDTCHNVISVNKKRFDKKVTSGASGRKSEIFFNLDETMDAEAISIARYIGDMIYKGNIKPEEIAVISRVKKFEKIADALKEAGIKYEMVGNRNFYYEPEIQFIMSWLKVIDDIKDEISMTYILKSGRYRIGDRDLFFLKNNIESGRRRDLIDGIRGCRDNKYLSIAARQRLSSFLESLLLYIKKSGVLDLKELVSLIFEDSGLSNWLRSGFGQNYKSSITNIEDLIRIASDFKKSYAGTGNDDFVTYIRDVAKTNYDDPDTLQLSGRNSVKMMSIHAAKGLEFKAVILPMLWKNHYFSRGGSNSRFAIPSDLRKDSPVWRDKGSYKSASEFKDAVRQLKEEEERRIFYVACSRAKDMLLLSHCRYEDAADAESKDKKPKEMVPFFTDMVKSGSPVVPMNKDAVSFLKEIDPGYENDITKSEVFSGSGKRAVGEKNRSGVDYDWNKLGKGLAAELDKVSGGCEEPDRPKAETVPVEGQDMFSLTPLLDYLDCPALYRLRYIYSIPGKINRAMAAGQEVHKYLEDISRTLFSCGPESISGFTENAGHDIKPYTEAFMESRFADMVKQKPDKLYLEKLFYFRTNDAFITGKLDRLDIRGKEAEVVDYKISRNTKDKLPARYRIQISLYMAAVSAIAGINLPSVTGSIFFLGSGNIATISGDEKRIKDDVGMLTGAIDGIRNQEFERAEKDSCSKQCPYYHLCR